MGRWMVKKSWLVASLCGVLVSHMSPIHLSAAEREPRASKMTLQVDPEPPAGSGGMSTRVLIRPVLAGLDGIRGDALDSLYGALVARINQTLGDVLQAGTERPVFSSFVRIMEANNLTPPQAVEQMRLTRARNRAQRGASSTAPTSAINPTLASRFLAFTGEVASGQNAQAVADLITAQLGAELVASPIAVAPANGDPPLPNDPKFGDQWGLHNIGQTVQGFTGVPDQDIDAPEGWEISEGRPEVVIAVTDSGIAYNVPDIQTGIWLNHPELTDGGVLPEGLDADGDGVVDNDEFLAFTGGYNNAFAMAPFNNGVDDDDNGYVDDFLGWDLIDDLPQCGVGFCCHINEDCDEPDNNPIDSIQAGHGTILSSIIRMEKNNGLRGAGVAPGVKLMAVRCGYGGADGISYAYHTTIGDGVLYAYQMGADVILIGNSQPKTSETGPAIELAYQDGVVIVASVGNDFSSEPYYPAAWNLTNSNMWVIGVGAINPDGTKRPSSNYGDWVDIAAPGGLIYRLRPANMEGYSSGTSPAAAHVAGVAAAVIGLNPDLTNEDVINIVLDSASPFLPSQTFPLGSGVVNLHQALTNTPLPPCTSADIDDNGAVDVNDLVTVILAWGQGPGSEADVNGDGIVNVNDLVALIIAWGSCP